MPRRKQQLPVTDSDSEDEYRINRLINSEADLRRANQFILAEAEVEGGSDDNEELNEEDFPMEQEDLDFIAPDDEVEWSDLSVYHSLDQERDRREHFPRQKGESWPDYLARIRQSPTQTMEETDFPGNKTPPSTPPAQQRQQQQQQNRRKRKRPTELAATGTVQVVDGPTYLDYLAGHPFDYLKRQQYGGGAAVDANNISANSSVRNTTPGAQQHGSSFADENLPGPSNRTPDPYPQPSEEQEDQEIQGFLSSYSRQIGDSVRGGGPHDASLAINFQTYDREIDFTRYARETYDKLGRRPAFVDVQYGVLLRSNLNGELSLYYSSNNTSLFDRHLQPLRNGRDLARCIDKLSNIDLNEKVVDDRPDKTSEINDCVPTNSDSSDSDESENETETETEAEMLVADRQKNIIGKNFKNMAPWESFFSCLAIYTICKQKEIPLCYQERHKKKTKKLFREAVRLTGVTSLCSPEPVSKEQLMAIGSHYGIHIYLYSATEKWGQVCSKNCDEPKPELHLLQWENGSVSLMKDPEVYWGVFACDHCNQDFSRKQDLERHKQRKNCDFLKWRDDHPDAPESDYYDNADRYFRVKNKFIGGKYVPRKGLLQEMLELGFPEPPQHKFQPYLNIWDIETMLPKSDLPKSGSTVEVESVHVPISISVLSNIPGYDTCKTFIGFSRGSELTKQWLTYMNEMSDKALKLAEEANEPTLQMLNKAHQECLDKGNQRRARRIDKLLKRVMSHMRHLPSIGFNSSRFDLPAMIRSAGMAYWLSQMDNEPPKVIKRSMDSYTSLTSTKLRFLDLCLFLSPGISLRSLVRQSGIKADLSKLYFPYNFLTSRKRLHHPRLPDYTEFFSDLKQTNVLDEDHRVYENLLSMGKAPNDALKEMNLEEKPPTGQERYLQLQQLWTEMGFKFLWEYLALYNCFDCLPLLQVVEKIREQFWELIQYDCFEFTTISSLAFPFLMQNVGKYADKNANFFSLLNEEAFEMVEQSVVGGIAHSFNKCALANLTEIEPHRFPPSQREKVKATKVLDLNSLYASTIGINLSQTLGFYAIRRNSDNFKMLEVMEKSKKALIWLDYWNEVILGRQHYIRTALSVGGEKMLHLLGGRSHRVDGWCEEEGLALEFNGCFWHGCPKCFPNRDEINPRNGRSYGELYEETKYIERAIKEHPIVKELVTIWECDWDSQANRNVSVITFLKNYSGNMMPPEVEKGDMEWSRMLELILDRKVVGYVQCDMEVPKTVEMYSKMSRFPPFFVKESIGVMGIKDPKQRALAIKLGRTNSPQPMLFSKMNASGIVIPTELLIFYCQELQLKCTNIEKVLQFHSSGRPFQDWLDNILSNRAKAKAEGKPFLAMTIKLLANSAFGYGLLRLDKRTYSKFVLAKNLRRWIAKPEAVGSFIRTGPPELPQAIYEVIMRPKTIKQNLPREFSAEVLGVSKIPLLMYIHVIYPKYFRPTAYTLGACDTDSLITSFSSENLEDCCKPEMLQAFMEDRDKYFVPLSGPRKDELSTAPLLMKEEETGDMAISLSAKCYLILNTKTDRMKVASKGWQRNLENRHLTSFSAYFCTLFETDQPEAQRKAAVRGIRAMEQGQLFTYLQYKNALSKLSPKLYYCQRGTCYFPLNIEEETELYNQVYPYQDCQTNPSEIWLHAEDMIKNNPRLFDHHIGANN